MVIELTDDGALVLFELLHEYGTKDEGRVIAISHAAESLASHRCCLLQARSVSRNKTRD